MAYAGGAEPLAPNQPAKQFVGINVGNILRNGVGEQLQCAFFAAPFNTAEVIPGFTKALEGQTVGSQILVVIPPVDGYGTAAAGSTSELADQTLVFIVDIVGLG